MLLKIIKTPVLDYTSFTNKYIRLCNTYWHIFLNFFSDIPAEQNASLQGHERSCL